jgi:hypothetical protein
LQTQIAQLQIGNSTQATINSVQNRIQDFNYDPQQDETFDKWYKRNGKIIESAEKELDEKGRIQVLLNKLEESIQIGFCSLL